MWVPGSTLADIGDRGFRTWGRAPFRRIRAFTIAYRIFPHRQQTFHTGAPLRMRFKHSNNT